MREEPAVTDKEYRVDLPEIPVPATRVYAHSTRMSDFDSPDIERILKPAYALPAHALRITLREGLSSTHVETRARPHATIPRLKYEVKRRLHGRQPVVDLSDGFALETRFMFLGNYAHLVHDLIAPLRCIERTLAAEGVGEGPIHVVLPAEAPPLAVRVLEEAGIPWLATDGAVRGRILTASQELNIALLDELTHQPASLPGAPVHDRVFVSRRGRRTVLNDDAVTAFLAERGYVRTFMEDLSVTDQWALLGTAREIVGIHGAGLSSLGFSALRAQEIDSEGSPAPRFRLVELFSPGFSSTCFREYAAVLDGRWVGVRGQITPDVVRDLDVQGNNRAHDMASFEVDLAALEEALDYSAALD